MRGYVLVGLILCIVLISGCVEQPEEKAKQLADGTEEGNTINAMAQSFTKIKDCTMDEIISNLDELYESQGREYLGLTDEERATVETALETAKECTLRVEKGVSKISESKYLVSYSFISPVNCQQPMPTGSENFLQIEVNIATETTNVIKGAFSENQMQSPQTIVQQIESMGNCGAIMMMGSVSSSTAPVRQQT